MRPDHRRRTCPSVNRGDRTIPDDRSRTMTADTARATLIDGKAFAAALVDRVAAAAARLEKSHGVKPGLAVVIVGEDPASQIYVRTQGATTQRAGMRSDTNRLHETTYQADLLDLHGAL